jgi:multidrug efflux system membrane fusion protein
MAYALSAVWQSCQQALDRENELSGKLMNQPQHPTTLDHPTPATLPKETQDGKPQAPVAPPPKRSGGWVWLVLLIVVAAAAYYFWPRKNDTKATGNVTEPGTKKGGRGAGGPIPVVAAKSRRGDIGVYITGLGAVTPISTVTVKSRVDGQLMAVQYKEGDLVKQGDLLGEIDPRPFQVQLTQFEGQLMRDQANLENARVDQSRYETLLKQNAIPEQQLATQKALVAQDEGIVKSDQGQIDSAKLNLTYCKITAPITGRIGLRLVDPGNIVHASDSNGLLVIAQIQPISVIFTIAEDQLQPVIQRFHSGTALHVDAFDREMKRKIAQGNLTTIDNTIDQTTGTLKLRATFNNSHNELFPNQFVNARLLVQQKSGVILLQTAAIQRNSQSTYVYLVRPDSSVTVREITVGTTEGDDSEITSGLQPGDTVVMTGVDKLQEGSKVVVHMQGEEQSPGGRQGGGPRQGQGQGQGQGSHRKKS